MMNWLISNSKEEKLQKTGLSVTHKTFLRAQNAVYANVLLAVCCFVFVGLR